jgi:hypothetical protein
MRMQGNLWPVSKIQTAGNISVLNVAEYTFTQREDQKEYY